MGEALFDWRLMVAAALLLTECLEVGAGQVPWFRAHVTESRGHVTRAVSSRVVLGSGPASCPGVLP